MTTGRSSSRGSRPRPPRVVPGLDPGPLTGTGSRSYLVGEGRPVLVDTGSGVPAYRQALARALADEAGPPALVLVTHHHADHQGGLGQVEALAPGTPMWKRPHPRDAVAPARTLAGGEAIEVEGTALTALYTPGHASDHLCFHWAEGRTLFTGDLVLGGTTAVIPRGDGDLVQYLASLERLLDLDVDLLYPGHGEPIADPRGYIRHYLDHRRMREGQVLDALAAGLRTPADMAERIYTDLAPGLERAAAEQVYAHLVKLEGEGTVAREPGPGGDAWFRLR